jgi:hypothetical protein
LLESFKKHYEYYVLPLIVIALFLGFYFYRNFYPFGNNTIAHYDCAAQIVSLSTIIEKILSGQTNGLYIPYYCGGTDFFGILAYYIFNPFYILFLIVGKNNVYNVINIIYILQFITISISFLVFLNYFFKTLNGMQKIFITCLYLFSGYACFTYTFLTWMNFLVIIPMLIISFSKMLKTGKILPTSICLSCFIYTCFGLGSFSMFVLFIISIIFVNFVKTDNQKKLKLKVVLCFILGFTLSLPILVPSFIAFKDVARKNLSLILPAFLTDYSEGVYATKSLILVVNLPLICFSCLYFIKSKLKNKYDIFFLITYSFTFMLSVSHIMNESLNLGNYFGYYDRFGFIFNILSCTLTALDFSYGYFDLFDFEKYNEYKGKKLGSAGMILISISTIIFYFTFFGYYSKNLGYTLSNQYSTNKTLSTIIFFAVILAIFIFVIIFLSKKHIISLKLKSIFMTVILLIFMVSNFGFYFIGSPMTYNDYKSNQSALDKLNILNTERISYKINDYTNDGLLYDKNYFGGFSSMLSNESYNIMANFGYKASTVNLSGNGGTIFSDCFLSNKYIVYSHAESRSYLKLVERQGEYYIYENTLCFPFVMGTNKLSYYNSSNKLERLELIDSIYSDLGGDGKIVSAINILEQDDFSDKGLVENGGLQFNSKYKSFTYSYNVQSNGILYIDVGKLVDFDSTKVSIEMNNKLLSFEQNKGIYDCGLVNTGDKIEFKVSCNSFFKIYNFGIGVLDLDKLKTLSENLKTQTFEYNYDKGILNITKIDNNYKYAITPISALKGMYYKNSNNSNESEVINYQNFCAIDLSLDTQSQFSIYYKDNTFLVILLSILVSLIISIIIIYLNKNYDKFLYRLENFNFYAYRFVSEFVLSWFILVPTIMEIIQFLLIKFLL